MSLTRFRVIANNKFGKNIVFNCCFCIPGKFLILYISNPFAIHSHFCSLRFNTKTILNSRRIIHRLILSKDKRKITLNGQVIEGYLAIIGELNRDRNAFLSEPDTTLICLTFCLNVCQHKYSGPFINIYILFVY